MLDMFLNICEINSPKATVCAASCWIWRRKTQKAVCWSGDKSAVTSKAITTAITRRRGPPVAICLAIIVNRSIGVAICLAIIGNWLFKNIANLYQQNFQIVQKIHNSVIAFNSSWKSMKTCTGCESTKQSGQTCLKIVSKRKIISTYSKKSYKNKIKATNLY